jgi:hypothetical protein
MPRNEKVAALSQVLEADAAWLQMGYDPQATPKERRVRNAMADGAVNMIAGLIQMDGGHPAFPAEDESPVDLHAIIRGAKYDLHIALGETYDRNARFTVPAKSIDAVTVLGVIRDGFAVDVFELTPEVIEEHGQRRGGSIDIEVPGSELRPIKTFEQRF